MRISLCAFVVYLFQGCSSSAFLSDSSSAQFNRFIDSYFAGDYRETPQPDSAHPFPRLRREADSLRAVGAIKALRDLRAIDTVALELQQRVEWLQVEAAIKRAIRDTVLCEAERIPGRYLTVGGLYWQIAGEKKPSPEDWGNILRTLKNATKAVELGRLQLRHPPPLWIDLAFNTARRYEEFLDGMFLEKAKREAPDSLKAELVLHANTVVQSLKGFRSFLKLLNPGGENSWSVGKEQYNWLLKEVHFLPYSADEMIETGRRIHEETKEDLRALAKRVDPTKSWQELAKAMKERHPSPGKITEAYKKESDRARELILSKELITIPVPETLLFVPTPPALRETYAWGGYGGIELRDSIPAGRFFVTDVVPGMSAGDVEQKLRAQNDGWITVIALHEGYPGHHLQSLYSRKNPSKVRSRLGSTYFGEGWALYCEAWMARIGFYENADDSLAWLQMRLWRTARVIIDPSIHTGRMSYNEAVRFFMDEVGLEKTAAEAEVNRYTTWPTQAPSYIIGWIEIEKLRSELQQALGSKFSDREFGEAILTTGSLPPELLKRAVRLRYGLE